MRVLVTGSSGFIGSHLVDRLIERGEKVVGIDIKRPHRKDYDFKRVDIRDYDSVLKAVKGVKQVYHLAALTSHRLSLRRPHLYMDTNTIGTRNILEACRKARIEKAVFTSSSSIYGKPRPEELPLTEQSKIDPLSPYAISKVAAENYCKFYQQVYGLPVTIVRYFNVIGPRCRKDICLMIFARRVSKNLPPIVFHREATRDFTHVLDAVEATILAMENRDVDNEIFNIGAGRETSVLDLAWMVIEEFRKKGELEPVIDERRFGPHEAVRHYSDNTKARKLLKWSPRFTARDAVRQFVKWFKSEE
jgi:nucleoside-diphosphate-sugar epimerase